MILEQLILLCTKQLHKQRSVGAIYHLLNGKRSIQTLQDAHLFNLDRYYGILPTISRDEFEQHIERLIDQNVINKVAKDHVDYLILTEVGKENLAQLINVINYINGLLFYKSDELFYKKLLLLTQVLTNDFKSNSSYIPIIEDANVQLWVRQTYQKIKTRLTDHLQWLYDDLYSLLQHLTTKEAEIFVDRLTTFENYGLSIQQLSTKHEQSTNDIRLTLRAIVQKMLHLMTTTQVETRLLHHIVNELPRFNMLTKSAHVTYKYLIQHYSIEQIASIRRLKINTIYDHLIEICWYDQTFPVESYINDEQILLINRAIQTTGSLQLKKIKEAIETDLSYFQIRLALTRIKNVFAEGEEIYASKHQF